MQSENKCFPRWPWRCSLPIALYGLAAILTLPFDRLVSPQAHLR